ncbi:MAG: CoA-binding protein [Magnetococcales bacterium]|nr:CoA-binding protein [Magnetococcales bacterium]
MTDQAMLTLLKETKTIAVVGLSPKPDRASHRVAAYMQAQGYKIIPIRPAAQEILGETCYGSLKEIPADIKVDLVDVFRRGEHTPPIAEAATKLGAKAFWLQSGIVNDEAMRIVREAGMEGYQDLCLMVEHRRLLG